MKQCPFCAEEIQDNAIKCKHCNSFLTNSKVEQTNNTCESPPSYSFFEAINSWFRKYFDFQGRASRSEWFYFQLFTYLLSFIFSTIDLYNLYGFIPGIEQIAHRVFYGMDSGLVFVVAIVLLIPSLSVTARRFHDFNASGWWILLILPLVFISDLLIAEITLFCICAIKGNNDKNYY